MARNKRRQQSSGRCNNCTFDIHLGGSTFRCSGCGHKSDAEAPVYDDKVSSTSSPVERGRKQKF